ncbi:MAG: hypoxanthine phosphoribosyltransferase [Planctomycetales bacterium]|jgi:hypoxanthine phosphoribosyltransferase|nr:hypoxanthine phosphoribosyltransferase [Planctomycetales bacterium]
MYPLIPAHQIALRVAAMGRLIGDDYRNKSLTVLGVLNGSIILVADLIRSVQVPHRVGFVHASSYGGPTTASGSLTIGWNLLPEIQGRHVLLIDDIFDTGKTLVRLTDTLQQQRPASLRTAVLLWKQGASEVQAVPDYFGFQIPNKFVVGYGLDYGDDYRHLSDVHVLEESDLEGSAV